MKKSDCTIQSLLAHNYPFFAHRNPEGYSACMPSLGILVSAKTLDECYVLVEERKKELLESIVESGFGDSMLSVQEPSAPRFRIRMMLGLAFVSLVLLTILIPANFVLSEINRRVPLYVETAIDVAQRRIHQMSEEDKRKIVALMTRACPVVDEMVEAQCKTTDLTGFIGPIRSRDSWPRLSN